MDKIRNTILAFRRSRPSLQHLADACCPEASRKPPAAEAIAELRQRIGRKIGLAPVDVDRHHEASPWRFRLVSRIMQLADDPDLEVPRWLEEGTPVGIARPIMPSGLLPLIEEFATTTAEKLQSQAQWHFNHPSFDGVEAGERPAHLLLSDLVDQGFALVFGSASDAEAWLGCPPVPSPLGDVTKLKPDGSVKHRLIQDLRASAVNSASCVGERQVLPRFIDHATDLATATTSGTDVGVFILDFQNAFMTLPLHPAEMPFNTSSVPHGISRSRAALYPGEPQSGQFLVWRVLGFGGHSNPLTYSRAATFAARSGQALLIRPREKTGVAEGRLQLYVDDPILTVEGNIEEQHCAIDLLVLWWLCLGIPLSWSKGSFLNALSPPRLDRGHIRVPSTWFSHIVTAISLRVESVGFGPPLLFVLSSYGVFSGRTGFMRSRWPRGTGCAGGTPFYLCALCGLGRQPPFSSRWSSRSTAS